MWKHCHTISNKKLDRGINVDWFSSEKKTLQTKSLYVNEMGILMPQAAL